ncbi:MAG: hypothetical protein H6636_01190 [Anaerolineales bacterium]|nr:hypothetical protein [Anaerolineales bacterium]
MGEHPKFCGTCGMGFVDLENARVIPPQSPSSGKDITFIVTQVLPYRPHDGSF